jgi:hypothetical protein
MAGGEAMRRSENKLRLDNVTLCIADCLNPHLAARALEKSMQQCDFNSALFFTHEEIAINPGASLVKIGRMDNRQAYNQFILKDLAAHISTDFALLIQWDGYILDSQFWRSEFMDYDYIGARWHWHPEGKRVGNGGFSLRSRRLLNATSSSDFPVRDNVAEDAQICIVYHDFLAQTFNIRFAPESIAAQFSYERDLPNAPTFGFHGLFNMWRHCGGQEMLELIEGLDQRNLESREFLELLLTFARLRTFQPLFEGYRRIRQKISRDELMAKLGAVTNDPKKTAAIINLCEEYGFWPHPSATN